jgi:hypothetical protein
VRLPRPVGLLLDDNGEPIKAPLEGGGTPLETSLLRLNLGGGGARGSSHAYRDRRVRVNEAELAGGGGEEVKGSKHDVGPKRKGLTVGER